MNFKAKFFFIQLYDLIEIKMKYSDAANLLEYDIRRGFMVPTHDVKTTMTKQGFIYEEHWDVGFREGVYQDTVFVFATEQAAMMFSMHFQ